MRPFKLFLLVAILFTQPTNAQTATDSLIGKWKFLDICNKSVFDSAELAMAKDVFGDISFYFKANMHYKTSFMSSAEEGMWSVRNNNTILLTSNKIAENEVNIIKLSGDTLTISMGEPCFVLIKTTASKEDDIEEIITMPELVSATTKQISKKWFLQDRVKPNRTEEETKLFGTLIKGTYMNFKSDGSYEVQILSLTETGIWTFGVDNKSIITTVGKENNTWNIKSISETEVQLIKGISEEIWKFSTVE